MSGVTLSTPDSTGRVTPVNAVDPQAGVLERGEDRVDRGLEARPVDLPAGISGAGPDRARDGTANGGR
jgi:hypothetical protein